MKMIKIQFLGGESRHRAGTAVNYMIGNDLYAEHIVTTDDEMERYKELKAEIIEQAGQLGILESDLDFN